ncbi:DUF1641 domain-containing protein [Ectobacillus panaciterrae]|uniref:DUF1641 domain-containing protein n=1 Tax=Ectobacillus panaciterrae TaxID=363872 RepID=UPI00040358EF|nr:DUF1641 domain-containing protein [Ectobacillus panaciterrae]
MSQATIQQSQEASIVESQAVNSGQNDVLDQLLKPEIQESLTVLVENLPKLAEMVTFLTKSYDVAQSLLTDRVLFDDLVGGMQEFVKPVEEKVKECAAAAIEANDRAANQTTTIGLFGLLRMLKDPQVQKLFRFAQAYLDIMSAQQKQR